MSTAVILQQQGTDTSSGSVVRAAIHPAIGIARVGNSADQYFIGPEVPGRVPKPPNGYKDEEGRIKRQVARFRIYGLNADGKVVRELTADVAQITWTVHLANKKANWYAYDNALDIPDAPPSGRRNATASDRTALVIDPGPRSISGSAAQAVFDGGTFMGEPVPLGEIRTDDRGRLLVFGGHGKAGTPLPDNPTHTYGNNDGWFDDIADGSVTAQVLLDGQEIPVTPAWVITAQPDYAPAVKSIVTLYDIVSEVAMLLGMPEPGQVSFTEHIYPIFQRFWAAQWVNQGFLLEFGFGMPHDFLDSNTLIQLADNRPEQQDFRMGIFRQFRNPAYETPEPNAWPPIYGDRWRQDPPFDAQQWLAVSPLLYRRLQRWAQGDFQSDWSPGKLRVPESVDDLPLPDRPAALDRAALEACMGGPFHPGGEATWPLRQKLLYAEPFRIKVRPSGSPETNYGNSLTPEVALRDGGPLDGSSAGDITRWMAVPWQTDVSSCGAGYNPDIGRFLPTFWPARVPNHVLTEESYRQVIDNTLNRQQRIALFYQRDDWLRGFGPDYKVKINQFVKDWGQVGIVVEQDGPTDEPSLPSTMYVEVGNTVEMEQRINPRHNA